MMSKKKNPFAVTRIQEIPFTDRIKMRENVLAWISNDTGLYEFLVPNALAESWSAEQKQTWTNAIVDNFLNAPNTEVGKLSRGRVMAREQAGNLRRGCDKLRRSMATYRDIAKMGLTMEGLWNDISPDLDDNTWARCSLLYDTALISLRVSYLWLYDTTENDGASAETRKKVFNTLLDSFFTENAPTDDKDDKQSDNFRQLLKVWRAELLKYAEADNFDEKLKRLETTQPLAEVGAGIDRFLNSISIDSSWMWKMKQLDDKLQNGHIVRKGRVRGRKKIKQDGSRPPSRTSRPSSRPGRISKAGTAEAAEGESSSFEPAISDSDFDLEDAEKAGKKDDDDEYEEYSSELSDDLAKGTMSQRRDNGNIVRRSLRVAQLGSTRKKRRSRVPSRLGDSPDRKRLRRGGKRGRPRKVHVQDMMDEYDDEPPTAADTPVQSRGPGKATRRHAPPPQAENDDLDLELGLDSQVGTQPDSAATPGTRTDGAAPTPENPNAQREARRRRLMAALNGANE